MKYKIGDKVVIVGYRTPRMNYEGGMDQYFNMTMTIERITKGPRKDTYKMVEDNGQWYWNDNMINHTKTTAKFNNTYKRF